jgi:hypothetical protein
MALGEFHSVLVIDWPSREVPERLALAGLSVVVRSGPGPEDFSAYEVSDGVVQVRRTGRPPAQTDLVYVFRPLSELPQIIDTARSLRARAVWTQSGLAGPGLKDPKGCWLPDEELQAARRLIETAGMQHIAAPYIVDLLSVSDSGMK